ncbi:MAG: Cation transport ATPase [Ignavibacteria bacterium]|nr:Cation transport ATPase [Ignavibacteria bacterium]
MMPNKNYCAHCGAECKEEHEIYQNKYFCCSGCLFVYNLLQESDLTDFYKLAPKKGFKVKIYNPIEFEFLDLPDAAEKLIVFSDIEKSEVRLHLPQIYCNACIYLLENLPRLNNNIISSKVNFNKKEISLFFRYEKTTLRSIAELLASLGYKPDFNATAKTKNIQNNYTKSLHRKIGIAGFCFGNIMLFSFPEYLSKGTLEPVFGKMLGILSIVLSLPVLYSASDYFRGAIAGIRLRMINMDIPISIGIVALYIRSFYEVLSGAGSGYFDSLTGLVFFLLIGKVFQNKTFSHLTFDREFKSYFPISVLKKSGNNEQLTLLKDIKIGDILIVRNNEIIPADSALLSAEAYIDYSFITGESLPTPVKKGDKIYAGGRLTGSSVEVEISRNLNQSYLAELWNRTEVQGTSDKNISYLSNLLARNFSYLILVISALALAYWLPRDPHIALNAFIAILVIACPCALALSIPFSYGTAMRIMSRNSLYIKNTQIVERLAKTTSIIFDKTGTLSDTSKTTVEYSGNELSIETQIAIKSATRQSIHPMSRLIYNYFDTETCTTDSFIEHSGRGIEAIVNGKKVRVGSYSYVTEDLKIIDEQNSELNTESKIWISIDNERTGHFYVQSTYRENISQAFDELKDKYKLYVLSGDNATEKPRLEKMLNGVREYLFNQMPDDKAGFVESLRKEKETVLMLGDGLNDAAALSVSDCGIAVSDSASNFSPASDAIIMAGNIARLPRILTLAKRAVRTVYFSFFISLLYNAVGLSFAVAGKLTPVIAAILMPLSSITIVFLTMGIVTIIGKRLKL